MLMLAGERHFCGEKHMEKKKLAQPRNGRRGAGPHAWKAPRSNAVAMGSRGKQKVWENRLKKNF